MILGSFVRIDYGVGAQAFNLFSCKLIFRVNACRIFVAEKQSFLFKVHYYGFNDCNGKSDHP